MIQILYFMSFCATFKMCIVIHLRGCCQVDNEEKVDVDELDKFLTEY